MKLNLFNKTMLFSIVMVMSGYAFALNCNLTEMDLSGGSSSARVIYSGEFFQTNYWILKPDGSFASASVASFDYSEYKDAKIFAAYINGDNLNIALMRVEPMGNRVLAAAVGHKNASVTLVTENIELKCK